MKEKEYDLMISNYGTTKHIIYDICLLPWGSCEPHNYHLPYLTDSIIAREIALRVAEKTIKEHQIRCMVLPSITFGSQNIGQIDLPFCIHVGYQTQFNLLKDIVSSMNRQGLNKLLIINGHGGNSFKNMLHDLCVEYSDISIIESSWFNMVSIKDYFENPGNHADEVETSMMMYLHPEMVNLTDAGNGQYKKFNIRAIKEGKAWTPRNWSAVSEDTGIGSPKLANALKGEKCTEHVVAEYVNLCCELVTKPLYSDDLYL